MPLTQPFVIATNQTLDKYKSKQDHGRVEDELEPRAFLHALPGRL